MKTRRQEAILEIIEGGGVGTQELLRERLLERGIDVTQATLSRDIREMGLVKGTDCYTLPERLPIEIPPLLSDSVEDIDYAGNTAVFKCRSGMAGAACATLDGLCLDKVVGTLAGDDTIFILMRTEKDAESFVRSMRRAIFR